MASQTTSLCCSARKDTSIPHEVVGRFGAAPTKFDVADIDPLTARYLQGLSAAAVKADLDAAGVPEDRQEPFWSVIRENINTRADIATWWALCRDGADPVIEDEDKAFVAEAMGMLPDAPFDAETWSTWTGAVKAATGRKGRGLFMPLRLALTGQRHGPDMASLMPLLQVVKARP